MLSPQLKTIDSRLVTKIKRYSISEIFGPTIQGEGPLIGVKTFFVRFAGCDWDCDWCDTKYAVKPHYPGWVQNWLDAIEIRWELVQLGIKPGDWITMSGGNPALFVDTPLLNVLADYKIAMETQGSWPVTGETLARIKSLVVSPKPPSSKMHVEFNLERTQNLIKYRIHSDLTSLKFVVFTEEDLTWTKERLAEIKPDKFVRLFLSIGTPLSSPELLADETQYMSYIRNTIMTDWAKWADRILQDEVLSRFTLLPQLHTLAWGQKRGK